MAVLMNVEAYSRVYAQQSTLKAEEARDQEKALAGKTHSSRISEGLLPQTDFILKLLSKTSTELEGRLYTSNFS